MTRPNIEERLTAAAFNILTDENRHSRDAKVWALRFMDKAAGGRPTAFQRRVMRSLIARTSSGEVRG